MSKYEKDGYMQELKSWAHFFDAIVKGDKKHDLRSLKDRKFYVGEIIRLRKYDNIRGEYTGHYIDVKITYMTSRYLPCAYSSAVLDKDYAILSIEPVSEVVKE